MTNTRRLMMSDSGGGDLPSGYTRLEYIEGQGAIVTDYIPQSNSRIFFDWQQTENGYISSRSQSFDDGSSTTSYHLYNMLDFGGVNICEYHYYEYTGSHVLSGKYINFNGRKILSTPDTNRHYIYFSCEESFDGKYNWTPTGNNLVLLACNSSSVIHGWSKARLYACKIWEFNDNDITLICDYIPVADQNGNLGVFDLIEGKFFLYKQVNIITTSVKWEEEYNDFTQTSFFTKIVTYDFKYPMPSDYVLKYYLGHYYDGRWYNNEYSLTIKKGDTSFSISAGEDTDISMSFKNEDDYYYYHIIDNTL